MISLSMLYVGLVIFYAACRIKSISRSKLTREVLIIFVIKLLILTAIYLLFFANSAKIKLADVDTRYFNKLNNEVKK